MAILTLPLEIQILILGFLDTLSAIRLQQTSKKFYNIIESTPSIWKGYLYRQCVENSMFWPSFSHLTTPIEFQKAAMATARFARSYGRAVQHQTALRTSRTRIALPYKSDTVMVSDWVNDIWLIPGGRYVVTMSFDSHLDVLDLRNPENLELVVHIDMTEGGLGTLDYHNVVDSRRLHLLLSLGDVPFPNEYLQSINGQRNDEDIHAYEFIELEVNDGGEWTTRRHGKFAFICHEDREIKAFSISGTRIIILLDNGTTIAWNYSGNSYGIWDLVGTTAPPIEIFSNEDYVMYNHPGGIVGVQVPDLQPLLNGYAVLSTAPPPLSPAFAIEQPEPHADPATFSVLGPDICKSIDGHNPLIYFARDPESEPVESCAYRFVFNPADPASSALERLNRHRAVGFGSAVIDELVVEFYSECDGRLAMMWRDAEDDPCYVSLSSPAQPSESVNKICLAPFITQEDIDGRDLIRAAFCPGSATAAVLWVKEWDEDDVDDVDPADALPYIELYHFV